MVGIEYAYSTHEYWDNEGVVRLVRAGLLTSYEWRDGGSRLARPAAEITLADVYRALRAAVSLPPSPATPNPNYLVGSGIREALDEVADEAQLRLLAGLTGHTIAEVEYTPAAGEWVKDRAVSLGAHPELA